MQMEQWVPFLTQKLEQRATDDARHILKTHEVIPLDKNIWAEMDRILARAGMPAN